MKRMAFSKLAAFFLLLAALLVPVNFTVAGPTVARPEPAPPQQGNVPVNGFFSVERARQGSSFQAAIVMDIPRDLHVNSNKPLGKYAVPTTVKIDAPKGMKISPLAYPAAKVRTFNFGGTSERLAVYEGRSIIRFNVTVPQDFNLGVSHVKARVRYQSCSDTVCFPPVTRDLNLAIAIVRPNEPSPRINEQYFGSGRGRRR